MPLRVRSQSNANSKPKTNVHPSYPWLVLQSLLWGYGALIFWECLLRVFTGTSFLGIGLVSVFVFSLPPALFIAGLRCFCSPVAGVVVQAVFLALGTVLYTVQLFYYFIFKTYLTLYSVFNGTQALQFADTILNALAQNWYVLLCALLPLAIYLVMARKVRQPRALRWGFMCIALAVVLQLLAVTSLRLFGTGYFSLYDYYHNNLPIGQTVAKLGLFTASRLDAQRLLLGSEVKPGENEIPPQSRSQPVQSASLPPKEPASHTPEYGYNVLDIDFTALADAEKNSTLQAMHQYFGGLEPTRQNEYTGMLKGYNLITITAESFAPYAIDETLTPTLYKMKNEGISFSNFYCPEWGVSTLDGEYANMLGLIPKQGVWSMYLTAKYDNSLPFSLGHQFQRLGYQTHAYHNHTYSYYNRNLSHPHLGYDYKGLGNGLEVDKMWPESDLQMIEASTGDYLNGQPFHTYYLTVSGHRDYTFGGNAMAAKNRHLVENLPLREESRAYLASNIELDRAMELLLKRLQEAGVADRTLIVISPDHPPYGLSREAIAELSGMNPNENLNYYKSSLIFYSPGLEAQVVDKPCSSLDILPTISNLFGLPYDSRLLMGRDIFSDAPPMVVLGDRSWITDKAMFSVSGGTVVSFTGQEVDRDYVETMNQIVADKFLYSAAILEQDYYRYAVPGAKPDENTE